MQQQLNLQREAAWEQRQADYQANINAHNKSADSTYCHGCGELLIGRDWYELFEWNLDDFGHCRFCGNRCAGVFSSQPGKWGAKSQRVII
jgi:pyruvate formate lyase activating enzyme